MHHRHVYSTPTRSTTAPPARATPPATKKSSRSPFKALLRMPLKTRRRRQSEGQKCTARTTTSRPRSASAPSQACCLPAAAWRPTGKENGMRAPNAHRAVVRMPSAMPGERIARKMYSQGTMSRDELIRVVEGEEMYYKGRKPGPRDPITLEPMGDCQFIFVRPNGSVVRYNCESLIDYCVASGDFSEPESRIPFSDADLGRIDSTARKHGLRKPSVVLAKMNSLHYHEMRSNRDLVSGLDACAGEVVAQILNLIEDAPSTSNQTTLLTELFPQLYDWLRQLQQADRAAARQCAQQYISLLQGPPNRPIQDKSGLKAVAIRFLQEMMSR